VRTARARAARAPWAALLATGLWWVCAGPARGDDALAPGAVWGDPGPRRVEVLDMDLTDRARDRAIPIRLRVPQPCTADAPRPLVLFSHGLGGSRAGGESWGTHWAGHGFVVAHLQHPGSDESLWRGLDDRPGRIAGLRSGMTPAQYVARVEDVRAALDGLAALAAGHTGLGCIATARVGMSGHSFGALTTQAVAGQSLPAPGDGAPSPWAREPRVAAAVAFSPSVRDRPATRSSLATVAIPFLAITGSLDDDVAGTGATPAARRAVFDALPGPGARLLWFEGADHRVFGGGPPRMPAGAGRADDATVQRAARAVTLAFWRATLLDDPRARAWLDDGGPRSLLGPSDAWGSR
jgi:predicted dienelactone hydrolase